MSTVEFLINFVNERLSAAVDEIFTVFENTIVKYEQDIERQRRLLESFWKPEIKLQRIGRLTGMNECEPAGASSSLCQPRRPK